MAKAIAGDGLRVDIERMDEVLRTLRTVGDDLPKQIRKANKAAAEILVGPTKRLSNLGTGQQDKLATTIRAGATQMAAKIVIGNARMPFAMAAFMGSRVRAGWFANPKYASGRESSSPNINVRRVASLGGARSETFGQFPPWVGNQWDPGESWDGHATGEPYVLGDALRASKDDFIREYVAAIDVLMDQAFPD